jgi:hypothetical protein
MSDCGIKTVFQIRNPHFEIRNSLLANAGREYMVNAGSMPAARWKQCVSLADFVAI